jgi:hypothetical protein
MDIVESFFETNIDKLNIAYGDKLMIIKEFLLEAQSNNIELILGFKDIDTISIRNSKFSTSSQNVQHISYMLELSQKYSLVLEYNACEECEKDDSECPMNECITIKK